MGVVYRSSDNEEHQERRFQYADCNGKVSIVIQNTKFQSVVHHGTDTAAFSFLMFMEL